MYLVELFHKLLVLEIRSAQSFLKLVVSQKSAFGFVYQEFDGQSKILVRCQKREVFRESLSLNGKNWDLGTYNRR